MVRYTIVIPTFNRPDALNGCLRSLTRLNYTDWDVVVVNDGGQDPQPHLDSAVLQALEPRLRLVTIPNGGPCVARNTGARSATGVRLAFTDDDCEIDANWLHAFNRGFDALNCEGLGGGVQNAFPQSLAAQAVQVYHDYIVDDFKLPDGRAILVTTNNAAYDRRTFEQLGGFNERINRAEDWEFGSRLTRAGYRQFIWPEAKVWHQHPKTIRELYRKQFVYGRGEMESAKLEAELMRPATMEQHTNRRRLAYLRRQRVPLHLYPLFFLHPLAYHAGQRAGRQAAQKAAR